MPEELSRDDWNRHWHDFSEASEKGPATRYRHSSIIRLLDIQGRGENVRLLDIGSGTGGFAELFLRKFPEAKVYGLELSESGIRMSRERVPGARFEQKDLLQMRATETPLFHATHAVCSEVLEHLDEPVKLLKNARRYMGPACKLVVTVPGGKPNAFDLYIGHRKHYTWQDLKRVLTDAGFDVSLATGIGWPFFNLYRMLTTARGAKLKQDVIGKPSKLVRLGTIVFRVLFWLNLDSHGWQTVAVGRAANKAIAVNA